MTDYGPKIMRFAAWKLSVDFGDECGTRRASAPLADLYTSEELVEKQVVGVINIRYDMKILA